MEPPVGSTAWYLKYPHHAVAEINAAMNMFDDEPPSEAAGWLQSKWKEQRNEV